MRISDWSSDVCSSDLHTNVVLAVLSGRAALVCPGGFADQAAVEAIAGLYAPHVAMLSPAEHAAFAGNAISASPGTAWMSAGAASALSAASREMLEIAGSEEHTSELQSLMRISYAVFCLKKKKTVYNDHHTNDNKDLT